MQRRILYAFLLGAGAILWSTMRPIVPVFPPHMIEYQGTQFKLTKAYTSYEDYKDDPANLDLSDNARVALAVMQAKIATEFSSRREMLLAISNIQFPGYGSTQFGAKPQPDGTTIDAHAVEIPRTDQERVFVFRGEGERYRLIDDFVMSRANGFMQLRLEDGKLIFSDLKGTQLLARPLAGNASHAAP